MIFIDDIIDSKLLSRRGKRLPNTFIPHIHCDELHKLVRLALYWQHVHAYGEVLAEVTNLADTFAEYEINRYLERHHGSVDIVDDFIIWTNPMMWVPTVGYVKLPGSPEPTHSGTYTIHYDVPDTQADLQAAGEQVEIKARPEAEVVELREPAPIVDGLPQDIEKPSEAWAWWLQQPEQVDKLWSARKIALEISKVTKRFSRQQLSGVAISIARTISTHKWLIHVNDTKRHAEYGVSSKDAPFDYWLSTRLKSLDGAPAVLPSAAERQAAVTETSPTPVVEAAAETSPAPEVPPIRYKTSDDGESTIAASEFDYVDGMMLRWSYYDGINYFVHRPWPQSLLPYQVFVDQLPAGICDVNSFELYENLAYALFRFDKSHCYRLDDFEMWCIGLCARRSFYNDQPWAVMDVQFEAIRQNLIEMGWQRGPINGSADHYIGPGRLMEANQIADHEAWEAGREVQRKVNEEAERLRNLRDDE